MFRMNVGIFFILWRWQRSFFGVFVKCRIFSEGNFYVLMIFMLHLLCSADILNGKQFFYLRAIRVNKTSTDAYCNVKLSFSINVTANCQFCFHIYGVQSIHIFVSCFLLLLFFLFVTCVCICIRFYSLTLLCTVNVKTQQLYTEKEWEDWRVKWEFSSISTIEYVNKFQFSV